MELSYEMCCSHVKLALCMFVSCWKCVAFEFAEALLCVVLVTIRANQCPWNDLSRCKSLAVRSVGPQAGLRNAIFEVSKDRF